MRVGQRGEIEKRQRSEKTGGREEEMKRMRTYRAVHGSSRGDLIQPECCNLICNDLLAFLSDPIERLPSLLAPCVPTRLPVPSLSGDWHRGMF